MNKKYLALISIVGVIAFFIFRDQKAPASPQKIAQIKTVSIPEAQEEKPEPVRIRPARLITESEMVKLRKSLPKAIDVRKEVEQNPHETPGSLMKFAKTLGPLVEKAKKNPEDADFLVKELGDCANRENVIVSARTVCLTKAEQLADVFPELRNEVLEIRKNADNDVTQLSKKMDSFIKRE